MARVLPDRRNSRKAGMPHAYLQSGAVTSSIAPQNGGSMEEVIFRTGGSRMSAKVDAQAAQPTRATHWVEMVDTGDILGKVCIDSLAGEVWHGEVQLIPMERADAKRQKVDK
jgi:hypothetical protein